MLVLKTVSEERKWEGWENFLAFADERKLMSYFELLPGLEYIYDSE